MATCSIDDQVENIDSGEEGDTIEDKMLSANEMKFFYQCNK